MHAGESFSNHNCLHWVIFVLDIDLWVPTSFLATEVKWAVVFAILIVGYAVAVPLYKKVSRGMSWKRKRAIAKSRDYVIRAVLADKHPTGEVSRYNWRAAYHYTIDGEKRQYTAYFKHPSTPPLYLYLYYVNDPDKLFSCEEYHYKNHKGIFLLQSSFCPGSWPVLPSSSWA